MTPIEVYTISKETVICHDANYYRFASFDSDKFYTDRLGEPSEALIQNRAWKIKKFTDGFEKRGGTRSYLHTYIAVDPKLEELLTMELKQDYNNRISLALESITYIEKRVKEFKSLPFYSRIWRAILNTL